MKNKLLSFGLIGTVLVALCCVTPLLPIVLTSLGLTSLTGFLYNDVVLLPVLAGFILITLYGSLRKKD